MEPKNSADNSAPSMSKQDEPQDTAAPAQSTGEISVDIANNSGASDVPTQGSDFTDSSIDAETSTGIGAAAAGGAVGDMPSLTSEAPTDRVAVAPTDPAEGAPASGDPGQPGSADRLGAAHDAPADLGVTPAPQAPSDAPGPQAPIAPVTDEPNPSQNTVPQVTPTPVPGHHGNKMMLLLIGAGALIIVIIALVFLV